MTTLAVHRTGSGAPLVLLHPLALAGAVWDPLTAQLADFDVLAVDQRGHGANHWDGKPFSITDMADDLAETLDAHELDAVHLLGMSMGGSVAATFAGRFPDRVRTLVLADTTAWYGPDAATAWAQRAAKASGTPRADQLPFQVDRWFSAPFAAARQDEVDRVSGIFLRTDSNVHAAASVAMGDLDARALLPSITAPTLVLVGEHDYATPPSMAEELADAIPGAKLTVLPELRHLSLVERPELATTIREHLSQ